MPSYLRYQVSVRKAALVALSRLLEFFPLEAALCAAWVRSALPLVRDAESSVQESLMDWADALLLDKVAAAANAGRWVDGIRLHRFAQELEGSLRCGVSPSGSLAVTYYL